MGEAGFVSQEEAGYRDLNEIQRQKDLCKVAPLEGAIQLVCPVLSADCRKTKLIDDSLSPADLGL
jgi:hypothetical protein